MADPAATIKVTLGDELLSAVRAHCDREGLAVGAFVRAATARAMKRGDLADRSPGRPPKVVADQS